MPSIYSEVRWGLHRVAQDTRILKLTACPWKWMVGRWNFLQYWEGLFAGDYVSFKEINYRFCFRLCFLVLCDSQVAPLVMEEGPQPWTWRLYTKVTLSTTSMRVSNQPNTKRCTPPKKKYSSDPHHDMLGGGCQVRVVIENMMGRMENLRTLISGVLGLVILVRWALVTMFLSWTTQTGCRIHIGLMSAWSGQVRVDIQLISWNVLRYSQLRRLTGSNLLTFFLTYLLTFFLTSP